MRKRLVLGSLLTLCIQSTWAYEVDTHAMVSDRAFNRSVLAGSTVSQLLGWDRYVAGAEFRVPLSLPEFTNTDAYLDLVPADWSQTGAITMSDFRAPMAWERRNFPGSYRDGQANALVLERDIRAWLMRGTVREDDLALSDYDEEDPPPDADPHGEITRVFAHFFDPINDQPLAFSGLGGSECTVLPNWFTPCVRSTDWAMGETSAAGAMPALDLSRRNHFSWSDAREAMWCALTYRKSGVTPQRDAALRRFCWATTMKSLGHALHLLQDTAQPQHVRNDRHNPPGNQVWDPTSTNMARRTYEIFTNWRSTGGEIASPEFEEGQYRDMFGDAVVSSPPSSRLYPIPRFARASDYFTTRRDGLAVLNRRGLADFTNRNFFSEGTVYSNDYPFPPSDPGDSSYTRVLGPVQVDLTGRIFHEELVLYSGTDAFETLASDPALAATDGKIPLAYVSLWDGFAPGSPLVEATIPVDFYATHADMLIPRAVAYSAGMIDYFFRGSLEVLSPSDTPIAMLDHGTVHTVDAQGYPRNGGQVFGFRKARLRIRNTTPSIAVSGGSTVSQSASGGQLVAVARYHRNPCYLPNLDGEWTFSFTTGLFSIPSGACTKDQLRTPYEELSVSAPILTPSAGSIDGGSPTLFEFDFSSDPIPVNATDLRFQVVYRGQLGEERDGIAVGLLDAREPGYYVLANESDWLATGGVWQMPPATGPDAAEILQSISSNYYPSSGAVPGVTTFDAPAGIAAGRYIRIAIIDRNTSAEIETFAAFGSGNPQSIRSTANIAVVRQAATEQVAAGVYAPHPFARVRGESYDRKHRWYKIRNGDVPSGDFGQTLPGLNPRSPVPGIVVFRAGIPARTPEGARFPAADTRAEAAEVIVVETDDVGSEAR